MPELNKQMTIMVADDEDIVLSLVSDTLEDEGYRVLTAIDSYECLDTFDTEKIDILISDIRMPKMNGIELVKRAKEKQPDIAIIFMTGYANLNSAKEAITQGASDYILKPFDLDEMRAAVDKAATSVINNSQINNNDSQLEQLNDLNELLMVGDEVSQIQMSLKFAITHSKADHGSFLSWNSSRTKFRMITIINDKVTETELPTKELQSIIDNTDLSDFLLPKIIDSKTNNPLLQSGDNTNLNSLISPSWQTKETPMVMIRVNRTLSIYGIMMINAPIDSKTLNDSNLKFLSITAQQLALSLENIELLEESQSAYHELKELQDETIQLDKMATKGEMSAEIGHELNNFLGVVVGSMSLLEYQIEQKRYDNLDKYLHSMNDNINKIKKFTSNLMEYKPISGKTETIFFNKILTEVVDYLKPQKRYREVEILFEPCSELIPFKADILNIQQLLYNLFNNAADAMIQSPHKQIIVKTALCNNQETFIIYIKDNGEGISDENLVKAFTQKFTTKETGHGFGLLVCKKIIESHQGTLHIDSTVGEGTTISIEFPLELEATIQTLQLTT